MQNGLVSWTSPDPLGRRRPRILAEGLRQNEDKLRCSPESAVGTALFIMCGACFPRRMNVCSTRSQRPQSSGVRDCSGSTPAGQGSGDPEVVGHKRALVAGV